MLNVGSGGGAAAAPAGGAAGGGAADAPVEEAKEEKEEGKHIHPSKIPVCTGSNTTSFGRERRIGRGHGSWSIRLEGGARLKTIRLI